MERAKLEDTRKPRRWVSFDAAFIVLLIATGVALAFVLKLSKQNADLKSGLAQTKGTLAGPQSAQAGDIVPGFRTVDLAGRPIDFVYNGSRKSLIYIFSSGCGVCVSELPSWNRIASEAILQNYDVRGLSLDSLEESRTHLVDKTLVFDVSTMPSMPLQRAYRVVSIPEVLLVSGDGTVDWVHYGAMTRQTTEEMLAMIRSGR
jgi:thiol-disulfide isomerase/thioredoxin